MRKAIEFGKVALGLALTALVVWMFIQAGAYNTSRAELCERNGLTFGSEYMGTYGCVELHPFEEFDPTDAGRS